MGVICLVLGGCVSLASAWRFAADRRAIREQREPAAPRVLPILVAVAIAALVAAMTFAASLNALVSTPVRYGWNWDAILPGSFEAGSADLRDLTSDPAVAEISLGGGDSGFRVVATYSGPDTQAPRSMSIDQTMQISTN